MGFCNVLGLRSGGVWLNMSCSGKYLVWHHFWPADIVENLVSSTNRQGAITNYNMELSAIILHEATLIAAVPEARLDLPHSGLDNTQAVSWSTN